MSQSVEGVHKLYDNAAARRAFRMFMKSEVHGSTQKSMLSIACLASIISTVIDLFVSQATECTSYGNQCYETLHMKIFCAAYNNTDVLLKSKRRLRRDAHLGTIFAS